jgi:hypothetical protein
MDYLPVEQCKRCGRRLPASLSQQRSMPMVVVLEIGVLEIGVLAVLKIGVLAVL